MCDHATAYNEMENEMENAYDHHADHQEICILQEEGRSYQTCRSGFLSSVIINQISSETQANILIDRAHRIAKPKPSCIHSERCIGTYTFLSCKRMDHGGSQVSQVSLYATRSLLISLLIHRYLCCYGSETQRICTSYHCPFRTQRPI